MIVKWTKRACTAHHPLPASECPLINGLIANLIAFREHGPEFDASNVCLFDLEAIVKGFDHLVVAHNFLSRLSNEEIRRVVLQNGRKVPHFGAARGAKAREWRSARGTGCGDAMADHLCSAHCYVLHRDEQLY